MASLVIPRTAKANQAGSDFTQKSFTSVDLSSGVALVPAITGKVAVIDRLLISPTAAETMSLKAGSDFLVDTLDIVAGPNVIENVASDVEGEAITLVVSAGQVAGLVHYHYE
jgi:hypothetical protein